MGTLVGSRILYLFFLVYAASVQFSASQNYYIISDSKSSQRGTGQSGKKTAKFVESQYSSPLLQLNNSNKNFVPLILDVQDKPNSLPETSPNSSNSNSFSSCLKEDKTLGFCTSPAKCLEANNSKDQEASNQFQTFLREVFRIGVPHFYSSCMYLASTGLLVKGICCVTQTENIIKAISNEIIEVVYTIEGPLEKNSWSSLNDAKNSPSQLDRGHVFQRPQGIRNHPPKIANVPPHSKDWLIWNNLPGVPINIKQDGEETNLSVSHHTELHQTHPPLPTHSPDHTNKPWWTIKGQTSTSIPVTVANLQSTITTAHTVKPWTDLWIQSHWTQSPSTAKTKTPTKAILFKPPSTPSPVTQQHVPASTAVDGDYCSSPSFQDMNFVDYDSRYGNTSARIVGGGPITPYSKPWMVILYQGQKHICGGSLIDETHILTAAHCVATLSNRQVSKMRAVLGVHNLAAVEPSRQEFKIKTVVRHKDYSRILLYNDIALLTLASPVEITKEVRPICLYNGKDRFVGQYGLVVGWGSFFEGGRQVDTPRQVSLQIWTNEACTRAYGPTAPGGIVESYMCAGQQGKDACSGDSGGPIVKNIGGFWNQIGIVSWGIGCGKGHYPGVYSRMTSFLPWIRKVKHKY